MNSDDYCNLEVCNAVRYPPLSQRKLWRNPQSSQACRRSNRVGTARLFSAPATIRHQAAELGPSPETAAGMKTGQQVPGFSPLDDRAVAPEKLVFQLPSFYCSKLAGLSGHFNPTCQRRNCFNRRDSDSMPYLCDCSTVDGTGRRKGGVRKSRIAVITANLGLTTRTFSSRATR